MERLEEITSVILNILTTQNNSLSIVELAELTGIHRNVLAKYIKVLEAQGKIEITKVGTKKFVHVSQRVSVSFLKIFTRLPFFVFDRHLKVFDKNDEISELFDLEHIKSDDPESQNTLLNLFLTEEIIQLLHNAILGQRGAKILETSGPEYSHLYCLTILPVVFDNGRPGAALIIENSTKRELEKQECDNVKSAYRELLENQVQFVVRFTSDYKIISANSNFSEHTGIEEQYLIGSQFIPPYPEDNYSVVVEQMSSLSSEHPSLSLDLRRINKNGDFSWERWKVLGIYDEKSGLILEYVAFGLDITDLKRNEQEFLHLKNNLETIIQTRTIELREVNNELHKEMYRRENIERELTLTKFAIDSAQDFIFLLNSSGDVQYMNECAQEILAKQEGQNINIKSFLSSESHTGAADNFSLSPDEMIDSGIRIFKGTIKSEQGIIIPVEITMSRIVERGEAVFCCIARDITDRNKIERDLYNYRKHLEEIIEERTKRLEREIDAGNAIKNAYKKCEERLLLFTENGHDALFIYDGDTHQYQDLNHVAEQFFSINPENPGQSLPEKLSSVILKNNMSLYDFLEEKIRIIRSGDVIASHEVLISKPHSDKEIAIRLKGIDIDYHLYIVVSIIDISALCEH